MATKSNDLRKYLIGKAESLCAGKEFCEYDILQKLTAWKASSDDVEAVLEHLRQHDFVNNARYAESFCRGKFHQLKWGRSKITYQLRMKRIDPATIDDAMLCISEEEYLATATAVAAQKWKTIHEDDRFLRESKLSTYMQSKGYESYAIRHALSQLN